MRIINRPYQSEQSRFSDDVSPFLQKIFQSRGLFSDSDLNLNLTQLPSPDSLLGLDIAVDHLVDALELQQKIVIVGDFDADGATSSALMMLALGAMGFESVDFLVPNRFDYGYGLTPEIVELAQQKTPDIIITVDNGISSVDGVDYANQLGIKVIVTDHHLPGKQLPAAAAIINPNQPGCEFPCKNLAGVAVAFYLLSALRAKLRSNQWFENNNLPVPNMANYLDLVALGTVADVVPLDQVNRVLVNQGLLRIRSGRARPGIHALLRIAGKDYSRIVASDMGFAVGPRLNAAGRLDDISRGIQCLLTDDPAQALALAQELEQLNHTPTMLVYVSDHGESLGENGLFLHALPYAIAPQTQTRVPMIFWASPGFKQRLAVEPSCAREQSREPVTHDHIFHTLLDLLGIQSTAKRRELAIFAGCRASAR